MAGFNFDASQVPPDEGNVGPVPAGWYDVIVDNSEIKPTSDGTGTRLNIRFSIVSGQYANRKVFTGFNIQNKSEQAVEISMKQLSALMHAVGVIQMQQTEQLHNIPLKVRVKVRPAANGYDASNDITAYKNINEVVDQAQTGGANPVPANNGFPGAQGGVPPQFQQPQQQAPVQQPVPQQQYQQPAQQAPQQQQAPQYQQQPDQNGLPQQPWQQQPQQTQQPAQQQPQQPAQQQQYQQQPAAQQQAPAQQYQQQPQQQQAPVEQAPAATAGAIPPWVQS